MVTTPRNLQPRLSATEEAVAKRSAAWLSIIAAAFLIALKGSAGWMTGSVSVLASLLDSGMDIFASTLNFFAVRAASNPADEEHHYGHGKAESLGGLFQAVVIGASGVFLMWEAVNRIREQHETRSEWVGIVTMIVAIGVSAALVSKLRRVARETESPALSSDALHYATDIYINIGVLLALGITLLTGWRLADPLISIAIALYILWSAASVGRESIDLLMDKRLPADVDEVIAGIVGRYREEGVVGFHNLRTRRAGAERFVDLHLEIERHKTFEEAHELTVKVLRNIEEEVPRATVNVHTDPV